MGFSKKVKKQIELTDKAGEKLLASVPEIGLLQDRMTEILKDIVGAIDTEAIQVTGSDNSMAWFDEWMYHARKAIADEGENNENRRGGNKPG